MRPRSSPVFNHPNIAAIQGIEEAEGTRALVLELVEGPTLPKETLACAYLSFTLLPGLLANATLGWWWADPVAALLIVPWLTREGLEALGDEPWRLSWVSVACHTCPIPPSPRSAVTS